MPPEGNYILILAGISYDSPESIFLKEIKTDHQGSQCFQGLSTLQLNQTSVSDTCSDHQQMAQRQENLLEIVVYMFVSEYLYRALKTRRKLRTTTDHLKLYYLLLRIIKRQEKRSLLRISYNRLLVLFYNAKKKQNATRITRQT